MNFPTAATALLTVFALSARARADASFDAESLEAPTRIARPEPKREWYGWQTLTSDGVTLATTAVLLSAHNNESYGQFNFYAGYLLGGPTVHAAHGNWSAAAGSLALRGAMPLAGTFIGCAAHGDDGGMFGCLPGAALGFIIGMGGAIAIDSAVLAYVDAKPRTKTFEVLPSANVSASSATLGLQGIF